MNGNRLPGSSGKTDTEFFVIDKLGKISVTAHIEEEAEGPRLQVHVAVKDINGEPLSEYVYEARGPDKDLAIREAMRHAKEKAIADMDR